MWTCSTFSGNVFPRNLTGHPQAAPPAQGSSGGPRAALPAPPPPLGCAALFPPTPSASPRWPSAGDSYTCRRPCYELRRQRLSRRRPPAPRRPLPAPLRRARLAVPDGALLAAAQVAALHPGARCRRSRARSLAACPQGSSNGRRGGAGRGTPRTRYSPPRSTRGGRRGRGAGSPPPRGMPGVVVSCAGAGRGPGAGGGERSAGSAR